MKYDLIVITKTINDKIFNITQRCIDSARLDKCDLNVIMVETNGQFKNFTGVDTFVKYDKNVFCYNYALNIGIKQAKSDIFILANNDIIFHKGWSIIGELMLANEYESACALSTDPRQKTFQRGNYVYHGYQVGRHIVGWCIFLTRKGYEKIGRLDESMEFWYSDNIYSDQLIYNNVKHGLFCNIQIDHIASMTLKTLPFREQKRISYDSQIKYKSISRRYAKRKEGD